MWRELDGGAVTAIRLRLGQLGETLADVFYPRCCAVCGADPGADGVHVCWDCRSGFEWLAAPICEWCGDPIEGRADAAFTCSWCIRHGPRFDRARSAVRFRGNVRELLHGFKYGNMTWLRAELVRLLHAAYEVHYADCRMDAVVSVPLYPRRERERSYNQAQLLADALSGMLGIPSSPRGLRRVRDTQTQTNLRANQRRQNVRGAFEVVTPDWVEGRRLLLVDDVMTTGATVDECSRVLKAAGAAGVYVLSVARG